MKSMFFIFCLVILAGTASASSIDLRGQDEEGSPGFENSSSYDVEVNNHDLTDDNDVELGNDDRDDDEGGDIDIEEVGDHDGKGEGDKGGDGHVVPEPSTLVLAGLGIVGLAIRGRRK